MAPDSSKKVRRRLWFGEVLAYVLIVTLAAWGFADSDAQRAELRARGTETRQVTANVVCGVYGLAVRLSTPPTESAPLTAAEQLRLDAILGQLKAFRDEQLRKLDIPRCEDTP